MTLPTLDPKLRNRLMRFLHTGNELPKYYPGFWVKKHYYDTQHLPVISEALANGANNVEVVNVILQVYRGGMYTRFETIAFALTKCLRVGSSAVKEATYKAAVEICNTPEQLLIFNKFTRQFKTGNGRGWCKSVSHWYITREPMLLAKEMTRVRSRLGRSHKTLIRKAHVKIPSNDHARDAVVKYAIFGLRRTKQMIGQVEGTREVLEYIQHVEDMRHCEDETDAARLAAEHSFTLDHVPGHLLTSKLVWNAILPQFTLEQLLANIQRIHNMAHLAGDSETTAILVSLLSNQEVIRKSKVTPLMVYITLCDYKKRSRPMKYQKAKAAAEKEQRRRTRQVKDEAGNWQWTTEKRHPKENKHWGIDLPPSEPVVQALEKLIDQTWLLTPPTKVRYMITLDMRHHMFKGRHFCKNFVVPKKGKKLASKPSPAAGGGDADTEKKSKKHLLAECFYNKHVTPGHAAIIVALQILKREKNVKLAVFTEEGVKIVSIERNFSSIAEAEFVLRNTELGRVQLDAPIDWAISKKHKVDVFINMIDRHSRYMELDILARGGRGPGGRYGPPPPITKDLVDHCPVRALERYRRTVGVKDAKLITMSLASHRVGTTDGSHEGVLDIIGIDEHVPKLIDAFALGQFK